MKQITGWTWEPSHPDLPHCDLYFVVEYNGALKTGPFRTLEQARDFYRYELDTELVDFEKMREAHYDGRANT